MTLVLRQYCFDDSLTHQNNVVGVLATSKTLMSVSLAFLLNGAVSAGELSAAAKAGEASFAICNACHNQALDPALAPPMWGVQRKYKRATMDKQEFIQRVVSFVKNPAKDKAVMRRPVEILGLMPAQDLPVDQLTNIATYLYEYPFPAPCAHWSHAVKKAEAESKVDSHIQKDKRMLQRFCGQ